MIYLIRHGQTDQNQKHVLQGRVDAPLNETGIQQAVRAGEALRKQGIVFDSVFTSPLRRARETAEIVAQGISPVMDERLIEMDCGPYEGISLLHLTPEILAFFRDFAHTPAPEGMEQLSSVVDRTGAFLEEIRDTPGNILIATHAIAMKGILEYLTPDANGAYWSKHIGNCEIYQVDCQNGQFTVPVEYWKDS